MPICPTPVFLVLAADVLALCRPGLTAAEQFIDANAEGRQTPPVLRHRISSGGVRRSGSQEIVDLAELARPKGFEPLTYASGGRRSIQLSYGRACLIGEAQFKACGDVAPSPSLPDGGRCATA